MSTSVTLAPVRDDARDSRSSRAKWLILLLLLLAVMLALFGLNPPWKKRAILPPVVEKPFNGFIDTHIHIISHYMSPTGISLDPFSALDAALSTNAFTGAQYLITLTPPADEPHAAEAQVMENDSLTPMIAKRPDAVSFVAGGSSLNVMLQSTPVKSVDAKVSKAFEERALKLLKMGARGFGEMTAEHLSFGRNHPYESVPPDHPLLLQLADIAAAHNVPLDLHMEAVQNDMSIPPKVPVIFNPTGLKANIAGFERLLDHNRKARILWAHAGWDNTGDRTVTLMRSLLERHPNLYMSIKFRELRGCGSNSQNQNTPLDAKGMLRTEWLEMFRAYPDRFVIGTDTFFSVPEKGVTRGRPTLLARRLLTQLPSDIEGRIAWDNACAIYGLTVKRPQLQSR